MDKNRVRHIKSYMALADVTPIKIARQLGMTRQWVSYVLNGHKRSKKVERAIAQAVGKPVEELWPDDNRAA